MQFAFLEATALLLAADREPEFDEVDPTVHQLALKQRSLADELLVFLLAAKTHDPLDPGAVIPGAVKHDDFARGGKVLHVALKIPLAALGVGRFFQCHQASTARVQVFHEAFDGAALAGRVTSFKQDDDALPGFLGPVLQLEQFDLQLVFLRLVPFTGHQVLVRVSTGAPVTDQFLVRLDSFRFGKLFAVQQHFSNGGYIVGGAASKQCLERRSLVVRVRQNVLQGDLLRALSGIQLGLHNAPPYAFCALGAAGVALRRQTRYFYFALAR